jgi:hypothetical protein
MSLTQPTLHATEVLYSRVDTKVYPNSHRPYCKMTAEIFSHTILIGTTELVIGDESMGHVYGEFIPTSEYFQNAQAVFHSFWGSNGSDYDGLESLRLSVQLSNGYFLHPIGGITIEDIVETNKEPLRIDIAGLFRHTLEDFLKAEPSRPFMEEPWHPITIEQKIAFENELQKEITNSDKRNFLFKLFNRKSFDHPLIGVNYYAIGSLQYNDDVLFSIHAPDLDHQFAVVHLTWKGSLEVNGWPKTELFESFDAFKHDRMYPDKVEWED